MFDDPWRPLPDIGDPPAGSPSTDDSLSLTTGGVPLGSDNPFYSSSEAVVISGYTNTVNLNGTVWIESPTEVFFFTQTSFTSFTNSGTIVVKAPQAVRFELFTESVYTFNNTGDIYLLSEDRTTFIFNPLLPNTVGQLSTFQNAGTISAWAGSDLATAFDMSYPGALTNNGTITAAGALSGIGVSIGSEDSLPMTLTNNGLIEAYDSDETGTGAYATSFDADGDLTLTNNGTLRAEIAIRSVMWNGDADTNPAGSVREVFNSDTGVIEGNILFATTDDHIFNDGAITGDISLGAGADIFESEDGTLVGTVDLGAGDDIGIGSAGGDTMNGGDGADSLAGGLGSDVINGGDGNDIIYGDGLPDGVDWLV